MQLIPFISTEAYPSGVREASCLGPFNPKCDSLFFPFRIGMNGRSSLYSLTAKPDSLTPTPVQLQGYRGLRMKARFSRAWGRVVVHQANAR